MTHDHSQHAHGGAVDCDAALEHLFEFLDGELDDSVESRLRAHVEQCRPCFERAGFERRFLEAVQAARDAQSCPRALRERVLSALRASGLQV